MPSPSPSRLTLLALLLAACGGSSAALHDDGGTSDLDSAAAPDTGLPVDATSLPDDASDAGNANTDADAAPPAEAGCSADTSSDPLNCGACGHDCLGATCTGGVCTPTVLAQAGEPTGIAVDAQHLYWADWAAPGGGNNPSILRANLDGSSVTTLASAGPSTYFPEEVVLFGDDVYWDNSGSSSEPVPAVARCAKAGCNGAPDLLPYAGGFSYGTGLAVSDAGIFWSGDYAGGTARATWRIEPGDAGVSGPIQPGFFVGGPLRADGDQIYFGGYSGLPARPILGTFPQDAPIQAPDAGTYTYQQLASLPYTFPAAPDLFVDPTWVYFTDAVDGVVGAIPRTGLPDGGVPRIIATGVLGPTSVISDDTNLYWIDSGQNIAEAGVAQLGSIVTCPKAGCGPAGPLVLARGLDPVSLAVDATYLYFTLFGNGQAPYDGLVMKVAK